jgi:hypothetical protein
MSAKARVMIGSEFWVVSRYKTESQGGIEGRTTRGRVSGGAGRCGRRLSVQSLVSVWERWLQEEDDEGEWESLFNKLKE